MNDKEKLFELEKEFSMVDKEVEKEKTKRNIILICIHTVISGFIASWFIEITSIEAVIELVIIALISGIALWIVPLLIFVLVTKLFTNVDSAEARRNHLEREINRIRDNY